MSRAGPPGSAPATSAPPVVATASPSSTGSPTCWTPPPTDIAALIARERDLASDISHQLRTRLTGLRLRLEELSAHPDPAVVAEVQAALDQTDRLVQVVDDLLANARSQRAAGATELVLAEELRELSAEWQPAFAAAKRQLTVRCPRGLVVHATSVRLREAIGVLVENALSARRRHGSDRRPDRSRDRGAGGQRRGPGDRRRARRAHVFDRGVSTADSTGIGLGLAGRSSRPTAVGWSCSGPGRRCSGCSWRR